MWDFGGVQLTDKVLDFGGVLLHHIYKLMSKNGSTKHIIKGLTHKYTRTPPRVSFSLAVWLRGVPSRPNQAAI